MWISSLQSRRDQKQSAKGQEGSTSLQLNLKTSDTSKDRKTNSQTKEKNGKKTKGDTEDNSRLVEDKDRNGHSKEKKKEAQDEEMETEKGKEGGVKCEKGMEDEKESQSNDDPLMKGTEDNRETADDLETEDNPTSKKLRLNLYLRTALVKYLHYTLRRVNSRYSEMQINH